MWWTYYMEGLSIVGNLRAIAALFLAALLAARILAQDKPPSTDEKPTFVDTFRFVMTPVTVTDHNGNVINGLVPKDFRLLDNDKLQVITEDIALHPISMVIAVQASLEVEKMLPAVQKLASVIKAQILGDDGEVAVLQF